MTARPEKRNPGMKPREFARRYGLSDNSVYRGCRDGSIPSVRVGNRYVILWEKWEMKAEAPVINSGQSASDVSSTDEDV